MTQESSGVEVVFAILIVIIFSFAGLMASFAFPVNNGNGITTMFFGLIVGVAVLLTIEYASIKIRRT